MSHRLPLINLVSLKRSITYDKENIDYYKGWRWNESPIKTPKVKKIKEDRLHAMKKHWLQQGGKGKSVTDNQW